MSRAGSDTTPRTSAYQADINVTPLVDVVLVLLIIFMVVTPYLQENFELMLPEATTSETQGDRNDRVTVAIDAEGKLYLAGSPVEPQALIHQVRALAAEAKPLVFVKADRGIRFERVRQVLQWLEAAGAPGVSLAVEHAPGQEG